MLRVGPIVLINMFIKRIDKNLIRIGYTIRRPRYILDTTQWLPGSGLLPLGSHKDSILAIKTASHRIIPRRTVESYRRQTIEVIAKYAVFQDDQ